MCDCPMKSNRIDCSNQPCSDHNFCCEEDCCEKRCHEKHCHEEDCHDDCREEDCREEDCHDDCHEEHCPPCHDGDCCKGEESNAILYANCENISPNRQLNWSSINKVGTSISWTNAHPSIITLAAHKRYFVTFNATLQRHGGGASASIAIRNDTVELFKFFGANGEMPEAHPETYSGSTLLIAGAADAKLNLFLHAAAASVQIHALQIIIEEL